MVQKRRHGAGAAGGGRRTTSLRKCRRSTPQQSGRQGVRREESGLVTDCWGKVGSHLLLLMATTLYVPMAFPWQSECLHPFTLLSEYLFGLRSG